MFCLLPFFFCYLRIIDGAPTVDVIYHELQEMNLTCPPYDSCSEPRYPFSDSLLSQNCHCGMFCNLLDTCCVDASHKIIMEYEVRPSCRSVKGLDDRYFIVDQCRHAHDLPSDYENLCNEEWDGQDNVMYLVPVTSLSTSVTYKNYFCLKCNEDTDDFFFWHISVQIPDTFNMINEEILSVQLSKLSYDDIGKTWVAQLDDQSTSVDLKFLIPNEITTVPKTCLLNVITKCDEKWQDIKIRTKCESYMALVDVTNGYEVYKYKNPHCALCNFENFKDISCGFRAFGAFAPSADRTPFSFTLLLDINRSDGENVGEIKRCKENNMWDPYFQKCRILSCALPGFHVNEGKCVRA